MAGGQRPSVVVDNLSTALPRVEAVQSTQLAGSVLVDPRTLRLVIDLHAPRRNGVLASAPSIADNVDPRVQFNPPAYVALGPWTGSDRAQRVFDIVVVGATAVFWLPLIALLALIVKCTSRGPAFYVQERVGRYGAPIRCPKLRTMAVDADERLASLLEGDPEVRAEFESRFKLRADPRVTRVGKFLRITGLDELPQLFNVLAGRMSLAGPRPITQAEVKKYGEYFTLISSVRPGMTGLWQISGRNDLTYSERVRLDVAYAFRRTVWWDVRILVLTLFLVFQPSRRGAY